MTGWRRFGWTGCWEGRHRFGGCSRAGLAGGQYLSTAVTNTREGHTVCGKGAWRDRAAELRM